MKPEEIVVPRSKELLAAIAEIAVLAEQTAANEAFKAPIRRFWNIFGRECDALGLVGRSSPWTLLQLLEQCLLGDEALPPEVRIEYASVVAGVRQITEQVVVADRAERASLN